MNKMKLGFYVGIAVMANFALWIFLKQTFPLIQEENGPMENFQAVCLALTTILSFLTAKRAANAPWVVLFSLLALFAATFLVLEVDFRKMDLPALNKIMNGRIRDVWVGSLWLIGLVFLGKNFRPTWSSFRSWLRSAAGVLMLCAGLFWITSALIDKGVLGMSDLFREELMEVNATLLMVWSAILAFKALPHKPSGSAMDARVRKSKA